MRAVIQRVTRGRVTVEGEVVGSIGAGFVVLLGVAAGDDDADAGVMAAKVAGLRVMADADGRMNRSVADSGGSVLLVSQFTLLADVRRGRRPSFTAAAPPDEAARLVDLVAAGLRDHGVEVETGHFGEKMEVDLVNDGPVTVVLDVVDGSVV